MNNLPINRNSYHFLVIAVIYVPALAIFAFTGLVSVYADIPIGFFLRDPTVTLGGHPLTGMQSNLGVLVWCAAAAICFFTGAILKNVTLDKTLSSFFLWSGMITSVLLLDDLFLFHDDLAIHYLKLDEKVILAGYFLVSAIYFVRFRKIILSSDWFLMFTAAVFFGSSIGIDFFLEKWESSWRIFLEDGFKFLGIINWSGYLIVKCFHTLQFLFSGLLESPTLSTGKIKTSVTGLK